MARRTRIFIASAGEDLEVAHNLAEALGQDFDVTAWDSGVFGLSQYRLESLLKALDEHDVGVVVLSPTDVVSIRGKTELAPRDNVVFELGMTKQAVNSPFKVSNVSVYSVGKVVYNLLR